MANIQDLLEGMGDYALTPAERRRLTNKYPKRGHAMPVGSGPKGETCGSCKNMARVTTRADRTFRKCGLMRAIWTNSYGTDVRAKDAACSKWEANVEER